MAILMRSVVAKRPASDYQVFIPTHTGNQDCRYYDYYATSLQAPLSLSFPYRFHQFVLPPALRHDIHNDIDNCNENLSRDEDDDNPLEVFALRMRHLLLQHAQ